MKKVASILLLTAAILLSAGGIAGFALLFVRDMNVFWIILSPIIFAMYQIPAVFIFWLWKRMRRKSSQENPHQNG
jgi:membrane protein implicated in regulation of membrane protease activity